jgi:hypothetical protein
MARFSEENQKNFDNKMNCPIQLITHIRSGTMMTWELFGLNFKGLPTGPRSIKPYHTHQDLYEAKQSGRYFELKNTNLPTIYIVRDGRDCLVSAYNYAKEKNKYKDKINNFHQFLIGQTLRTPDTKIFTNPIRGWIDHTQWINEDWIDTYKYEYIKDNQKEFIKTLADKYNIELYGEIKSLPGLVGKGPRKGISGVWKDYFSEDDYNYFWSVGGKRMIELGYEK